jgi:Bacterial protein of unknown function (DUF937)
LRAAAVAGLIRVLKVEAAAKSRQSLGRMGKGDAASMQMGDALRQVQGGQVQGESVADALAKTYAISPAQARAVMRAVETEFAWALETLSLNRAGLADLVELLGQLDKAAYLGNSNLFEDAAARADGNRVLALLLGGGDARTMLSTGVAGRIGISEATVAAMLPGLAALTLATLAARAKSTLGALLARMPALGRWSKGSPHADLADILRRGCGAGPYSSRKLPKVVRRCLARAGRFGGFGAAGWYVRFMLLRPAAKALRPLLGRIFN